MENKAVIAVLVCKILASSLLVTVVFAQTTIPKPFVPEFTIVPSGPSFDIPPTYSFNSSTGLFDANDGYHIQYSTVKIIMKNQQFLNQSDNDHFYYNIRIRPQNYPDNYWLELFSAGADGYPIQTLSNYTTIPIAVEGAQALGPIIPTGATTDIQVEAMIGHIGRNNTMIPYPYPYVLFGENSGWSNTQTVTLPPKTAFKASPDQTPTLNVSLSESASALYYGTRINFTVSADGGTKPYTFAWYLDSQLVVTGGSQYFSIDSQAVGSHHVYVQVTDSDNNSATTLTVEFNVLPVSNNSPSLSLSPSSSQTQSPTIEPSQIPNNTQDNFTPIVIIFGLVAAAIALGLLVYFRQEQRKEVVNKKVLLAVYLISALLIPFVSAQEVSMWSWSKVESPTDAHFQSVNMVNSTDGWAVGSEGAIIRWDGTKWNNIASPTNYQLSSVDMVNSNEGYAIAFGGVIPINESVIRWDGTSWKNVTTPRSYLRSVDMLSSTDGWAVGYGGLIIRWNGTSWSQVESPINSPLESVDMVNSTDGWAVGWRAGYSGMLHWNGTSWNIVESPKFIGTRTLWSVNMVSSTEGWAVGDSGIIIRWNGTSWNNVTSPTMKHLFSVDMVNSDDGWAVGSDGCIIRWDGANWNNVTSPTTAWLSCVNMACSTDGWIVGADGIYRWQEEVARFSNDYLIIIVAVIVVVAVVAWFFIRNRTAHSRSPMVVSG